MRIITAIICIMSWTAFTGCEFQSDSKPKLLVIRDGGGSHAFDDNEALERDRSTAKALMASDPTAVAVATPAQPSWPHWRGPNYDGISREKFSSDWPADGLKEVWNAKIGIGFSSRVGSGGAAGAAAGSYEFWAALGFLLFLQITATVLNLLPVPGLDGFGIIEPYLPTSWLARASRVAPFAILILFGLLWIPVVNQAFFGFIFGLTNLLGVPGILIGSGYGLFQFWR